MAGESAGPTVDGREVVEVRFQIDDDGSRWDSQNSEKAQSKSNTSSFNENHILLQFILIQKWFL